MAMKKLHEVVAILNGDRSSNYPSGDDFITFGQPFVNAGHLQDGKVCYRKMDYISEAKLKSLSGAKLRKNDILLCLRGTLGKYAYVEKDGGAPASSLAVLRANESILPSYLFHLLGSHSFQSQIETENNGSSQPNLSAKSVGEFMVPVPPVSVQADISRALSEMDAMISILERKIAKKKAIKQGAMQELLTGKKRLPGFNGKWEPTTLGNLGEFIKGCGISRSEANSGKINAVRYGELYTQHNNYVTAYMSRISKDVAEKAKRVYYGDILFAASGETKEEIGKCAAIIDNSVIFAGGDILIFRPSKKLNPVFMGTLLNMPEVNKQRAEKGQGDAIVHIHAEALRTIKVRIPDIAEQDAIAELLLSMDSEIEVLEQKLAKARQLKHGMMQQLLTGKIRLV